MSETGETVTTVLYGEAIYTPETSLDITQDFEPVATPSKQVEACYETLLSVTNSRDGQLKDHAGICRWRELVSQLASHPKLLDADQATSQFIVDATLSLLDVTLIDLISQKGSNSEGNIAGYFRDETRIEYLKLKDWAKVSTEKIFPMTVSEASELYKHLDPEIVVRSQKNIQDIVSNLSEDVEHGLYFGTCVSQKEFTELKRYIVLSEDLKSYSVSLYVPVKMGDIIHMVQLTTANAANDKSQNNQFYPVSYVPLQDIWAETISHGESIYAKNSGMWRLPKVNNEEEFARLKSEVVEYIRKVQYEILDSPRLIRLHKSKLEHVDSIQHASHIHESYVSKEFGRNHTLFGAAETVITRSGVSANETAVLSAVHDLLQFRNDDSGVSIYFNHGWYFENEKSRAWKNNKVFQSADESNCNIICVNHNPTVPFPDGSQAFKKSRDELISRTIDRARHNPDQRFAIIYDKTADLNAGVFAENETMPPNLSVYETMSLSKHQRGDRNGFYGAVLHWGDVKKEELQTFRTRALGEPTEYTLRTFPHINTGDIRRSIEHNTALGNALEFTFRELQAGFEHQWKVEVYDYFAYIIPPADSIIDAMLKEQLREIGFLQVPDDDTKFFTVTEEAKKRLFLEYKFILQYQAFLHEYLNDTIYSQAAGTIEIGDSFGLDTTRLGKISISAWGVLYEKREMFMIPRISFGKKTTVVEVNEFVRNVIKAYKKQLEN